MRNKDLLPDRVRDEHDHYRTRLDMYAMLVIIGLILAVINPLILMGTTINWPGIVLVSGLFVLLSITSYHAAITSADAYGSILLELNRLIKVAAKEKATSVTENPTEQTDSGD